MYSVGQPNPTGANAAQVSTRLSIFARRPSYAGALVHRHTARLTCSVIHHQIYILYFYVLSAYGKYIK